MQKYKFELIQSSKNLQVRKKYKKFFNKKRKLKEVQTRLLQELITIKNFKMDKEFEKFKSKLDGFLSSHKCEKHKKSYTILCVDGQCENKGLICSACLTIQGAHKNHDAVDIMQYIENCFQNIGEDTEQHKDEVSDLLNRINENYDALILAVSKFIEFCKTVVEKYVKARTQLHQKKKKELRSKVDRKFYEFKLQTISQLNQFLRLLPAKSKSFFQLKNAPYHLKSHQKALNYVDDTSYQLSFISQQIKLMQSRLKQVLVVKQNFPLVLNREPFFNEPKIIQNNDYTYIGEAKENVPQGKGICYYHNGSKILFGTFIDGKAEGINQLYYLTGDYFIGEFKSDKKNGRGIYRWIGQQSSVYEGQFQAGRRNGRGTFWWSDDSKYVGMFLQGQQTGLGTLYRAQDIIQYEGYWLNGMFHGKGKQYFLNGQIFQGNFKEDKFHGEGILRKQNETIYGLWNENQLTSLKKQVI